MLSEVDYGTMSRRRDRGASINIQYRSLLQPADEDCSWKGRRSVACVPWAALPAAPAGWSCSRLARRSCASWNRRCWRSSPPSPPLLPMGEEKTWAQAFLFIHLCIFYIFLQLFGYNNRLVARTKRSTKCSADLFHEHRKLKLADLWGLSWICYGKSR